MSGECRGLKAGPSDIAAVCFHEAAHAVFAAYFGAEDLEVHVEGLLHGPSEDGVLGCCRRNSPAPKEAYCDGFHLACLYLAGGYAQWQAVTGQPLPHVPFEDFVSRVEGGEAWMSVPNVIRRPVWDGVYVLRMLRELTDDPAEQQTLYERLCSRTAEFIQLWWEQITVIAARLGEVHWLGSAECGGLIQEVGGLSRPDLGHYLLMEWNDELGHKVHAAFLDRRREHERQLELCRQQLLDREEVEEWKCPGGWLYELIGPEQLGYLEEDDQYMEGCL